MLRSAVMAAMVGLRAAMRPPARPATSPRFGGGGGALVALTRTRLRRVYILRRSPSPRAGVPLRAGGAFLNGRPESLPCGGPLLPPRTDSCIAPPVRDAGATLADDTEAQCLWQEAQRSRCPLYFEPRRAVE